MITRMPAYVLRATLFSAVLTMLTLPAAAQQSPQPQPEPSANSILLAREIITVKGASRLYEPVIVEVVDRTTGVLEQTNPSLSKDLNEVAAKLKSDMAPRVAEIMNEVARMYASRFTEQELKEVLAFYRSPVGQKIIVQEPAILDESVAFAETWATNFSEQVLASIRAEMKKRGHEL